MEAEKLSRAIGVADLFGISLGGSVVELLPFVGGESLENHSFELLSLILA